ncbi:Nif3-like dinuclear metal center hexameric protein [Alteromonas sp. ASW11-19]|uniref:Nif3-like dinuclear metal center hexameric protein n=2 Tax=Alteromonas salexigens TaxID=2982530 RepID=A0ABT2VPR7_9ALTE|nr:Nif3-like dinuclear metal center hexameric protein [Alteromonas salexigens]
MSAAIDELLNSAAISDYCPNGLQVAGKAIISKVVTGVTASQALIEKAIDRQADAILVHHGYFWKGEDATITGMKRRRIKALLEHDINLLAYHLPLDIHPQLGNNAQLGQLLSVNNIRPLSGVKPEGIVMHGELDDPAKPQAFADKLTRVLARKPLIAGPDDKEISRVAWCTGGGQGFIEQAVAAGVDAFITGEVSEQTVHTARECGVVFFAAGHHATERYGVKALGEYLAEQYAISVEFIDIPNPV